VQAVYDRKEKQEWIDWASKMIMLRLHIQIELEKRDEEIM
jgi:hypothetical protein